MTPCLAGSDRADASFRKAAQLARLKQDLPGNESDRPRGQSECVSERDMERGQKFRYFAFPNQLGHRSPLKICFIACAAPATEGNKRALFDKIL